MLSCQLLVLQFIYLIHNDLFKKNNTVSKLLVCRLIKSFLYLINNDSKIYKFFLSILFSIIFKLLFIVSQSIFLLCFCFTCCLIEPSPTCCFGLSSNEFEVLVNYMVFAMYCVNFVFLQLNFLTYLIDTNISNLIFYWVLQVLYN